MQGLITFTAIYQNIFISPFDTNASKRLYLLLTTYLFKVFGFLFNFTHVWRNIIHYYIYFCVVLYTKC